MKDAVVLDAGSGAGYGSDYLAGSGARFIWGIDVSEKSIAFSQHHFQRDNLDFRQMDLGKALDFPTGTFDFTYTSNALEHVPNVTGFLREAWRLLKPNGTLLIAVPPITDRRLEYLNLINPYHVNIWTPRQWSYLIGRFFGEITPYLHGIGEIGADFLPEHMGAGSTLTERDLVFEPGTVDGMYRMFTLTAVFVARRPLPEEQLPRPESSTVFVDESYTRPPGYIDPRARERLKEYFAADRVGKWELFRRGIRRSRQAIAPMLQELSRGAQ